MKLIRVNLVSSTVNTTLLGNIEDNIIEVIALQWTTTDAYLKSNQTTNRILMKPPALEIMKKM